MSLIDLYFYKILTQSDRSVIISNVDIITGLCGYNSLILSLKLSAVSLLV